jgi:hypothetical protein
MPRITQFFHLKSSVSLGITNHSKKLIKSMIEKWFAWVQTIKINAPDSNKALRGRINLSMKKWQNIQFQSNANRRKMNFKFYAFRWFFKSFLNGYVKIFIAKALETKLLFSMEYSINYPSNFAKINDLFKLLELIFLK